MHLKKLMDDFRICERKVLFRKDRKGEGGVFLSLLLPTMKEQNRGLRAAAASWLCDMVP
jgi:hypothetical protein